MCKIINVVTIICKYNIIVKAKWGETYIWCSLEMLVLIGLFGQREVELLVHESKSLRFYWFFMLHFLNDLITQHLAHVLYHLFQIDLEEIVRDF